MKFPESYREFLKRYGGGYFAYTVIYSGDSDSDFYILKRVTKKWVDKYHFLPVIDFETGDLGGFKVNNGRCDDWIYIFVHEEEAIVLDEKYDLFQALVKYGLKLSRTCLYS